MKTWQCACGARVFFENIACNNCGRALGYDVEADRLQSLLFGPDGSGRTEDGLTYRYCDNHDRYQVCNWLIPAHYADSLCRSCSLNEVIPALLQPSRRAWWADMEAAKRRLVYSLTRLDLPLSGRSLDPNGLGFAFLEDQRSNPLVEEQYVPTGHADGLITVNLAEADAVHRERARVALGESYRTLLGHFRHESGHYYFDRLVRDTALQEEFRALFGDDSLPYEAALQAYYSSPPAPGDPAYISTYARSHPLEDWAECWAHYLHIVDTLETASAYGLVSAAHPYSDVDEWIPEWQRLTVAMNGLNRSMGLQDAYPFVLGPAVVEKLHFVHRVIKQP